MYVSSFLWIVKSCYLTPVQVIPLRKQVNVMLPSQQYAFKNIIRLLYKTCGCEQHAHQNSEPFTRTFASTLEIISCSPLIRRHFSNYKVILTIFLQIESKLECPCLSLMWLSSYITTTTLPQSKHKACGRQRESPLRFLLTYSKTRLPTALPHFPTITTPP